MAFTVVSPTIWDEVRDLKPPAQVIFLYVATGRYALESVPGLLVGSHVTFAAETGLSVQGFLAGMKDLQAAGQAQWDRENRVLSFPAVVLHRPKAPNVSVIKGWYSRWQSCPKKSALALHHVGVLRALIDFQNVDQAAMWAATFGREEVGNRVRGDGQQVGTSFGKSKEVPSQIQADIDLHTHLSGQESLPFRTSSKVNGRVHTNPGTDGVVTVLDTVGDTVSTPMIQSRSSSTPHPDPFLPEGGDRGGLAGAEKAKEVPGTRPPRAARAKEVPSKGHPDYHRFREHFSQLFRAHNVAGAEPTWDAGENGMATRLLRKPGGLDDAIRRAEKMFLDPPAFLVRGGGALTLRTLCEFWDALIEPVKAERRDRENVTGDDLRAMAAEAARRGL